MHDEYNRELPEELLIQPGDILINSTGTGTLGRSCVVEGLETRITWDSHVTLVRPDREYVCSSYLAWVIFSEEQRFVELSVGSTNQVELSRRTIFNIPFKIPALETQQRIADYLDRETVEIDAAVADLDRYVGLLEKRRHCIVESLLSEARSQMCPVGLIASVTLGKMVSNRRVQTDDVVQNYLRAAHVQPGGRLDFSVPQKKMPFAEHESRRLNLVAGDIVVVEGGAGFGRSAYLDSDLPNWGFQNSINRVRVLVDKADPRFVNFMLMRALLDGSIGIETDTATIPHFTAEKLSRFRIPFPSLETQKRIADHLDRETAEIDSLIAESRKLRDLLLKRRSVLITEVVTGRKQV
nr:restriction endonuclease subunit S [Corynebacterium marambiense]